VNPAVVAAVVVVGAVAAGGAVVAYAAVNAFWQGDKRWGWMTLGFGSSTIHGGGCLLTLFTMAANTLLKKSLTPDVTNELLKMAGAFYVGDDGKGTSLLVSEKAAPALGLKMLGRVRQETDARGNVVSTPTLAEIRAVVDKALRARGLAVLHVNHDGGIKGQHFVLVNGRKRDGSYTAADPAPGKEVPLTAALGGKVSWGGPSPLDYRPVGAFGLVAG
jgi:hypothetical protein